MEHTTIRKLEKILGNKKLFGDTYFCFLSDSDKDKVLNESKIKNIIGKELEGRKFIFENELSCTEDSNVIYAITKYCKEKNIRIITVDEYVELCDKYLSNIEWKVLFKRYGLDISDDVLKNQALANDLGIDRNRLIGIENHIYHKIITYLSMKDKREANKENKVRKLVNNKKESK